MEDLTVDSKQGREINPRFSNQPKFGARKPSFQKQSTLGGYYDHFPASVGQYRRRSPLADYSLQKSSSLDSSSVPAFSSPSPSPPSSPSSPTYSPKRHSKLASSFPGPTRRERVSSRPLNRMSAVAESPASSRSSVSSGFEDIREDEEEEGVAAVGPETCKRGGAAAKAFADSTVVEEDEQEVSNSNSVGVCGMEVTNSETETTVVLSHLLALKSPRRSSDMAIIEEDELEEEFYESQDMPVSPESATTETFALPHPIPRLIVTDELDQLVETVVQSVRKYSGSFSSSPLGLMSAEDRVLSLCTRL